MTLSPVVAEWAAIYEQEYGRQPCAQALQIAEHIEKVGILLREQGHRDAQISTHSHIDEIPMLVKKAFPNTPSNEIVQEIAGVWQSSYMKGYQEGGEA